MNLGEDYSKVKKVYSVSLIYFDDNVKDSLDEWAYSFKNHKVEDSFSATGIKEMSQKLDYLSMEAKKQRAYDKYLMNLAVERDSYAFAIEKGREEERIKSNKGTLNIGLGVEQISKALEISVDDINKLV